MGRQTDKTRRDGNETKPDSNIATKAPNMTLNETVRFLQINQTVTAPVPAERLWDCLVNEINTWWGPPYVSSDERQSLSLKPEVGAELFEDWGNGNGRSWATVTAVRAPKLLELAGTFMMPGAQAGNVSITLEAAVTGTTLNLQHQAIGNIDETAETDWSRGWDDLLNRLAETAIQPTHE